MDPRRTSRAALVIGGVYVASRQQAANRAALGKGKRLPSPEDEDEDVEDDYAAAEVSSREAAVGARRREERGRDGRPNDAGPQPAAPRGNSSMLLEALKEELFQLEVEHQQGRISHQEYETAKSALDQTLQRALKREAQKA